MADRKIAQRQTSNDEMLLMSAPRKDAFNQRMLLTLEIALSMLIFSASIISIYLQGN